MAVVLVVDDQPSITFALKRLLGGAGHQVHAAATAEDGLKLAAETPPDVVLLDVRLPGMDGITALSHFKETAPKAQIVVITAHGTVQTAVEALKRGAFDYLAKPFEGAQALDLVARATLPSSLATELDEVVEEVADYGTDPMLVGKTPEMQDLYKQVAAVASQDVAVCIHGESGSGKELVARQIHAASPRADKVFVPVNLAALPESLIESELFGHEPGAFTGAVGMRQGRFEEANGGTLFLDEIGETPLAFQSKLLRALEDRCVRRLGGSTEIPCNFRLVCATNKTLKDLVDAGRFREDLFYRVAVVNLDLPSLRERVSDIPLLVARFLYLLHHEHGVTRDFLDRLKAHTWPGNVRELRNVVERAVVMARGQPLDVRHLPDYLHDQPAGHSLEAVVRNLLASHADAPEGTLYETILAAFEEPLLRQILHRTGGNQVQAAKVLGIHRSTLKTKLTRYGLDPKDQRSAEVGES